jgi:hypothetical protein
MVPRQSNRAFGLMFAAVFALITLAGYGLAGQVLVWAIVLSAGFGLLALALPTLLMPLNRLWRQFAGGLGHVNNRVVLGLFLYTVMTPLGLALRLFGKDPMHRRFDPRLSTYLTPVGRRADAQTYHDMF